MTQFSFRTLNSTDAFNLRAARVHTLERRLFEIDLEAEERGGYSVEMRAEADDLMRCIDLHVAVLWPHADGAPKDSGPDSQIDPPRAESGEPVTELPSALGHEEDDVPTPDMPWYDNDDDQPTRFDDADTEHRDTGSALTSGRHFGYTHI